MPIASCRSLWTGKGPCLSNVAVHIDDSGKISSIENCSSSGTFDYDFAMPSFVDAHVHYTWMAVKEASLDLSDIRSSGEFLSFVQSSVNSEKSKIVRGESYDESEWINPELPSLAELDLVTSDVPVFLRRVCGHTALVNSAMLRLLNSQIPGVNRSSGILKEWPVMNFELLFPLPEQVLLDAFSRVESMILSKGITAVNSFESVHTAKLAMNLPHRLDFSFAIVLDDVEELFAIEIPSKVVKLFLDGSFGAGNAALHSSYPDGSTGDLFYSDDQLLSLLLRCGRAGFSIAVHAIGGKALQQLDRVSNSAFEILGQGFMVRIEHAEDLLSAWPGTWNPEFHIFSMQPNFVERWQRAEGMYEKILPAGQTMLLNPFRTVIDAGFQLGFGSDCMPLDPLYGLRGAVHHRSGRESLSMEEALLAYTLDAASISGLKHLAAPLAPGRIADMVFLSGNIFDGLDGITVEATMKKGSIVFDRNVSSGGI